MAFEAMDGKLAALEVYRLDAKAALPSNAAIAAAARMLGCVFPDDFRHMLAHYGPIGFGRGARVALPLGCSMGSHFSIDVVYGLGSRPIWSPVVLAQHTYEGQLPPHFVPIATSPGGDLLLMQCAPGSTNKVFAWDHEHREMGDDETLAAVRDLRAKNIVVERYDIGQLLYMWETMFPGKVRSTSGHGNLHAVAESFMALVDALQAHPSYTQ